MTFNVIACGGRDVNVTGLTFSRMDPQCAIFAAPPAPFHLAAGDFETIMVRYTPGGDVWRDGGEAVRRPAAARETGPSGTSRSTA